MRSFRESTFFSSNKRIAERKSVVGAFGPFQPDIFRDRFFSPHEEQALCVQYYNMNSLAQSAVNTFVQFIKGGEITVKCKDSKTRVLAQAYLDSLGISSWIDEVIENTVKTGNAYLELDFGDEQWKTIAKVYPIADSSRIYVNCDEYGKPLRIKKIVTDERTREPKQVEVDNLEEYYIQRVDSGVRLHGAKWYDMSYYANNLFKKYRIYGIPIDKRKIIQFRLNLSDNGIYGRSYLASSLDDWEVLKQIERSIAVIAKYKAVPRDIIQYGDKDNPATDDELDEFIVYLESLEKEESAIVNKPIKRESLAYNGQDINLDYMIQHINKKIVAGIVPDFMLGVADAGKADSQIRLISYILSIYSKRDLFLKPIEQHILKNFLIQNNLDTSATLEFGDLDFETKNEKTNRVGALWTQNILTLDEVREQLGLEEVDDKALGKMRYSEYQNKLQEDQMKSQTDNMMGDGAPPGQQPVDQPGGSTPMGGDPALMNDHQEAPNSVGASKGGEMSMDPYAQYDVNTPKFLPRDAMKDNFIAKPESYDLDNDIDFGEGD